MPSDGSADESRHCLDLFAGLGGFSAAFEDSPDWRVTTVDIEKRFGPDTRADALDLHPAHLPDADVVLASPPCAEFSPAQNLNGDHEPSPEAIALVYHTIGLIKATSPDYWFLENPRGKMRTLLDVPPAGTVTYCQYGRQYQKTTDLWGEHPPMTYRRCQSGAPCHINTREGTNEQPGDVAERAKVPRELSESILGAVEDAYANPPPEQSRLTEAA